MEDFRPRAGCRFGHLRPVERERVGFDQTQRLGERFLEPCGEIAVDFYGTHFACTRNQFAGQCCLPRADFDDVVAFSGVDGFGDALDPMAIVQKVLPEAFACAMSLKSFTGHKCVL